MPIDIDQLQNMYHLIWVPGATQDTEVLRQLDTALAQGVYALWNDPQESIAAYLFQKGSYTEETAQQWVADLKKTSLSLSIDDTSFSNIIAIVMQAEYETFETAEGVEIDWPWLQDVFTTYVIVRHVGKLYKIPYTLSEKNEITWGAPEMVKIAYLPLAASPATARIMKLGLKPLAAEITTDDQGLIWKEIFAVGTTFTATGEAVTIEQWMIDAAYEAWQGGAMKVIPITATDHFDEQAGMVPAENTVGMIKAMVQMDGHLYAGLEIGDEDIRQKLNDELIVDCSVFVWFDFADINDGEKTWDAAIVHLLLTNYPQLTYLAPFGEQPSSIAASFGGLDYTIFKEVIMPTKIQTPPPVAEGLTISPEDAALLKAMKENGVTAESLAGFQATRLILQTKSRDLEIQSIVAALEGKGTHAGVTALEGFVHMPAIINAVSVALRDSPKTMALSINVDTGATPLDAVILGIVNALPDTARLALEQPPTPDRSPQKEMKKPVRFENKPMPEGYIPTEEQIAAFDKAY
ncbi:MAG: hypothetical protein DRJ03_18095 [Chloroflexi bacterium]|nr:MAG: hypothetical protein DRJ03_18095 [Chloroflexota bacterium]